MVDISKLTAAQQKMVEEFKADGKISADELSKLEKAGVNEEILKELSSEFSDTGEVPNREPEMPKEEGSSWAEKLGIGAAVVAGCAVLGGIIGGVAGLFAGGVGAVPGAAGGAKLGAIAGAALLGLSSCSGGLGGVDIDQTVPITIKSVSDMTLQEILAELKRLREDNAANEAKNQARHEELMAALSALLNKAGNIENFISGLLQQGTKLDIIIELLVSNGKQNDEIIKLLKGLGKTTAQIFAALGDMKLEQSKQTEMLKNLVNNDNIKIDYLNQILNAVKDGNELQANETEILNLILAKIDGLAKDDTKTADLLNQILAKLTEFAKQEGDMDTQTHALLKAIIENQDKMSDDIKAALNAILAKLDSMDKADQERFAYLIPLLQNLGDQGTAILNAIQNGNKITQAQLETIINNQNLTNEQLESLRKLVMTNNEIAQGTQDAVKALKDQMNESQKAILDKIAAGNATLEEIKALLGDIKTGVDANTVKIGNIEQFVNVIGSALDKLLAEVKGIRVETQRGILEILAKIPEGCHCQPTDLSGILDLLNKLLEEVKKDPKDEQGDTSHEGILTDLDKYFK